MNIQAMLGEMEISPEALSILDNVVTTYTQKLTKEVLNVERFTQNTKKATHISSATNVDLVVKHNNTDLIMKTREQYFQGGMKYGFTESL